MITIYANWTGNALTSGETLDEARAKLTSADCLIDTVFGVGVTELTALDTGPMDATRDFVGKNYLLRHARQNFPEVAAEGLARLI